MNLDRRHLLAGFAAGIPAALLPRLISSAHADADGETIRFAIGKPAGDLNPHEYTGMWGVQDLMFEPLVKYGENGEIQPALATSWSVENDGKLLRLQLREGVAFQDGAPWNAEALKWNLDRWIHIEDHNWINFARLFDGLAIQNDHAVEIKFKEPPLGLLFELSYVRPVRFLSPTSVSADGAYKDPVGTGPWKQVEASDAGSAFERFDGYWGDKPGFKRLEMKVLPDSRTRMAALRAEEIDITGGDFLAPISANEAKTLKDAGVEVHIAPGTTTMILGFNPDRQPALRDPKVRQAISAGFDRAAIAAILYRGFAEPAGSLFASAVPYSGTRFDPPKRDVALAKRLLEESGWSGDAIRSRDGKPLAIELVVSEEQIAGSRSVAEAMQAQLREIGVDLVIRSVDHASRHSDIPARKFDMAFFLTFGAPYEPYGTVIGLFLSTYDNGVDGKLFLDPANLDPLILAAMSAAQDRSQATLQAVYDWLHDNHAIAPILYAPSIWANSKRAQNFHAPATEYDTPYEGLTVLQS